MYNYHRSLVSGKAVREKASHELETFVRFTHAREMPHLKPKFPAETN